MQNVLDLQALEQDVPGCSPSFLSIIITYQCTIEED